VQVSEALILCIVGHYGFIQLLALPHQAQKGENILRGDVAESRGWQIE